MHDVDRTLREFETESEYEGQELGEGEAQQGFLGSILGALTGEAEAEQGFLGEEEMSGETQEQGFLGEILESQEQGFLGERGGAVFDEVQEMELAAELLEVSNEEELEYFLGKLISSAGKAIGGIARSPIGQALGPILKKVAKTALPIAGAALGNFVLPGVGGALGGKLASAAGSMFGLELEGLSSQDREFEVARRFVRLGGAATQRAMRLPANIPVQKIVRSAMITAARRHAPGLLQPRAAIRRATARAGTAGPGYPRRPMPSGFAPRPTPSGFAPRPRPRYYPPATGGAYVAPSVPTPSYVPDASYGNGGAGYGGYTPDWGDGYGTNYGTGYGSATPGYARSGQWHRRGRKIVLVGV